MPNHYSDIGFEIKSSDDLNRIIGQLMPIGKVIRKGFCKYWLITVDTHIEFWQHMKSKNTFDSFEMHYNSQNLIPVRFDHWVNRSADKSNGSAYVWYHFDGDLFPFVVDIPDAGFYKKVKENQILNLQVSCFAEKLELFKTDTDYEASQTNESKFATEFFIPTGTFSPDDNEKEPTAYSWFAGHILSFEKRTNSVCKKEYYHFGVTCQEALFDIVADSELVTEVPVIGGILKTSCWMSGKVKEVK